jgi:hypothetical protein
MRKATYLFAVVAIALASLGYLAKSTLLPVENPSVQPPATISINDLHRWVDMKALPVQEVKDPI